MKIFQSIGRLLAPGLLDEDQVKELIKEEVTAARQAMPINIDYDPRGEGYRKVGGQAGVERDLGPVSQDMMLEIAYRLYDTSGLVKRFVRDTKNFVLGEGVTFEVENDTEDGAARAVLEEFWNDPTNQMALRLDGRIEMLGLLGEQCWPVDVNPYNGRVLLSYVDPANIDEVYTVKYFPEITAALKLKGYGGRTGETLTAIRADNNPLSRQYGRLVGNCFYWGVNKPPNGKRGRSDLVHLFDFIDAFEEGLFDELDRQRFLHAFIWDVELKGATDEEIKEFLRRNKTPKPGSVRAHNEQVKWTAVSPQLNHADNKQLFDLLKTYLSACINRPDSWLGGGGKAYQTEADLMGEPTFKELGSRQRFVKYMLEYVLTFVLDQAILKGRLRETAENRFKVSVNMPEMTTKDLQKVVASLLGLSSALDSAVERGWLTDDTAARMFASVASQVGIEIDAAKEIEAAAKQLGDGSSLVTRDYANREALLDDLVARIEARRAKKEKTTE